VVVGMQEALAFSTTIKQTRVFNSPQR